MPATSMESVSMGSATVFWALVVNIAINVSVFISGCHLYPIWKESQFGGSDFSVPVDSSASALYPAV